MSVNTCLSLKKIFLSYGQRPALRGVDFNLFEGEVHGLIGEHRAGKSSLVNIISGAVVPDSGEITIQDRSFRSLSPKSALSLGIGIVYQNTSSIPDYNVVENIFSGSPARNWWGKLDHVLMKEKTKALFDRLVYDIDLNCPLYRLSVAQQHMVEFARTLMFNPRIIILDELAQKLTPGEMKIVYKTIDHLKNQGVSFIYISHDLEEILKVSDRVTILNNGLRRGTEYTSTLDKFKLFEMSYSYSLDQEKNTDKRQMGYIRNILEATTMKATEGILVLDDEQRVFFFNPSLKTILPELSSDFIGKQLKETDIFKRLKLPFKWDEDSDRQNVILKDGKSLIVKTGPFELAGSFRQGKIIFVKDVTIGDVMDNYLIESERKASLAELAVGVAHEINNPLFIIKNYLKLLQLKNLPENEEAQSKIIKMNRELDRISGIVSNLLSFSRVQKSNESFDLQTLLEDAVDLIYHKFREKDIRFSASYPGTTVTIMGDSNRLKQVFLNILFNSIDAVLPGGEISIEGKIDFPSGSVTIFFRDNGCGIDEEIKDSILAPFFSTKVTKTNTGLGLTISKRIIDEFNGNLSFACTPDRGTVFTITLPALPGQ